MTKIASRSLTRSSNGGTNSAGIGSDISRKVAVVTLIVTRRRDVTQLIDSQVMPSGVAWLATIDARRRDRKGFPARGAHRVEWAPAGATLTQVSAPSLSGTGESGM